MAYRLILNDVVPVWEELGAYTAHAVSDFVDDNFRTILKLDNAFIDPLVGTLSGYPHIVYETHSSSEWTCSGSTSDWAWAYSLYENGYVVLYHHTSSSWTATYDYTNLGSRNFSLYFYVVKYLNGTNDSLTIDFGGVWKLILTENSQAELLKWSNNENDYVTQAYYDSPVPTIFDHQRLLIYEVGNILVIKNWAAIEGGIKHLDEEPEYDSNGNPHALRYGNITLSGMARAYLNINDLQWASPWSVTHPYITLSIPSSQDVSTRLNALETNNATVALTVYDEDGNEWAANSSDPHTAFYWELTGSSTSLYETAFVSYVEVRIGRTLTTSPSIGIELGDYCSIRSVEWTESLDPKNNTLNAILRSFGSMPFAVDSEMRLDFLSDNTYLFTGLIETPSYEWIQHDIAEWTLRADASRRLYVCSLFDFLAQDGMDLDEALLETIKAAAIPESNIIIPEIDYTLPMPDPDEKFKFVPDAGTSPGEWLDYLIEQVAADYRWVPYPQFQYAVIPRVSSDPPVATFYTTYSEAVAAGYPTQVVRSWHEEIDSSSYANVVYVIGQRKDMTPLVAAMVNWQDIWYRAPYLPRILMIIDNALGTQAIVNWVCRQTYELVSVKRIKATFESGYNALAVPGSYITVGVYNWRVLSRTIRFSTDLEITGWVTYEIERAA